VLEFEKAVVEIAKKEQLEFHEMEKRIMERQERRQWL